MQKFICRLLILCQLHLAIMQVGLHATLLDFYKDHISENAIGIGLKVVKNEDGSLALDLSQIVEAANSSTAEATASAGIASGIGTTAADSLNVEREAAGEAARKAARKAAREAPSEDILDRILIPSFEELSSGYGSPDSYSFDFARATATASSLNIDDQYDVRADYYACSASPNASPNAGDAEVEDESISERSDDIDASSLQNDEQSDASTIDENFEYEQELQQMRMQQVFKMLDVYEINDIERSIDLTCFKIYGLEFLILNNGEMFINGKLDAAAAAKSLCLHSEHAIYFMDLEACGINVCAPTVKTIGNCSFEYLSLKGLKDQRANFENVGELRARELFLQNVNGTNNCLIEVENSSFKDSALENNAVLRLEKTLIENASTINLKEMSEVLIGTALVDKSSTLNNESKSTAIINHLSGKGTVTNKGLMAIDAVDASLKELCNKGTINVAKGTLKVKVFNNHGIYNGKNSDSSSYLMVENGCNDGILSAANLNIKTLFENNRGASLLISSTSGKGELKNNGTIKANDVTKDGKTHGKTDGKTDGTNHGTTDGTTDGNLSFGNELVTNVGLIGAANIVGQDSLVKFSNLENGMVEAKGFIDLKHSGLLNQGQVTAGTSIGFKAANNPSSTNQDDGDFFAKTLELFDGPYNFYGAMEVETLKLVAGDLFNYGSIATKTVTATNGKIYNKAGARVKADQIDCLSCFINEGTVASKQLNSTLPINLSGTWDIENLDANAVSVAQKAKVNIKTMAAKKIELKKDAAMNVADLKMQLNDVEIINNGSLTLGTSNVLTADAAAAKVIMDAKAKAERDRAAVEACVMANSLVQVTKTVQAWLVANPVPVPDPRKVCITQKRNAIIAANNAANTQYVAKLTQWLNAQTNKDYCLSAFAENIATNSALANVVAVDSSLQSAILAAAAKSKVADAIAQVKATESLNTWLTDNPFALLAAYKNKCAFDQTIYDAASKQFIAKITQWLNAAPNNHKARLALIAAIAANKDLAAVVKLPTPTPMPIPTDPVALAADTAAMILATESLNTWLSNNPFALLAAYKNKESFDQKIYDAESKHYIAKITQWLNAQPIRGKAATAITEAIAKDKNLSTLMHMPMVIDSTITNPANVIRVSPADAASSGLCSASLENVMALKFTNNKDATLTLTNGKFNLTGKDGNFYNEGTLITRCHLHCKGIINKGIWDLGPVSEMFLPQLVDGKSENFGDIRFKQLNLETTADGFAVLKSFKDAQKSESLKIKAKAAVQDPGLEKTSLRVFFDVEKFELNKLFKAHTIGLKCITGSVDGVLQALVGKLTLETLQSFKIQANGYLSGATAIESSGACLDLSGRVNIQGSAAPSILYDRSSGCKMVCENGPVILRNKVINNYFGFIKGSHFEIYTDSLTNVCGNIFGSKGGEKSILHALNLVHKREEIGSYGRKTQGYEWVHIGSRCDGTREKVKNYYDNPPIPTSFDTSDYSLLAAMGDLEIRVNKGTNNASIIGCMGNLYINKPAGGAQPLPTGSLQDGDLQRFNGAIDGAKLGWNLTSGVAATSTPQFLVGKSMEAYFTKLNGSLNVSANDLLMEMQQACLSGAAGSYKDIPAQMMIFNSAWAKRNVRSGADYRQTMPTDVAIIGRDAARLLSVDARATSGATGAGAGATGTGANAYAPTINMAVGLGAINEILGPMLFPLMRSLGLLNIDPKDILELCAKDIAKLPTTKSFAIKCRDGDGNDREIMAHINHHITEQDLMKTRTVKLFLRLAQTQVSLEAENAAKARKKNDFGAVGEAVEEEALLNAEYVMVTPSQSAQTHNVDVKGNVIPFTINKY